MRLISEIDRPKDKIHRCVFFDQRKGIPVIHFLKKQKLLIKYSKLGEDAFKLFSVYIYIKLGHGCCLLKFHFPVQNRTMSPSSSSSSSSLKKTSTSCSEDEGDHHQQQLRRGPWTIEEDSVLVHYIARHGEGRWNFLAKHAGLRRTGKSCRLRWLNYLKPDVKRGNLTAEEQWSKIAQHLPGRTDNEIKNYWRTRVQKQARQLNVDANSAAFKNILRYYWMPRLVQKMEESSSSPCFSSTVIPRNQPLTKTDYVDGNSCVSSLQHVDNMKMTQFGIFGNNDCNSNALAKDWYGYVGDNGSYCHGMETINMASTSALVGEGFPTPAGDCHLADDNWVNDGFVDGIWSMGEVWELRNALH
ncbi:hypothetical protein CXB51_033169 [Gossypium anomalum]|uniref:Uncharacterized protein n=1 Tax=Gossypium anomalum TaxID=47600 RepID=A0A8J5YAP1_9ROSI|nr:hypothetical protein CXB51_033169 [Gossypium anomalum]